MSTEDYLPSKMFFIFFIENSPNGKAKVSPKQSPRQRKAKRAAGDD